jgi:putative protease
VLAVEGAGRGLVAVRNRFFPDETLELIGPGMRHAALQVGELQSEAGETLAVAQPNARVLLRLPAGAQVGDLLRREKTA